MGTFLGELRRRQAELAGLAARAEERLAPKPDAADDASLQPHALLRPVSPAALTCPESGSGFGSGLTVHHDAGARSAFMISQRKATGPARFALAFEAYEFDGSFLSFSLAAPSAFPRPRPEDALRLDLDIAASRPMKGFFRLVRARPGERASSEAEGEIGSGPLSILLDAPRSAMAPREDDALWVDVMFDRPRMASLVVHDFRLTLLPGEAGA